MKVNKPKSPFVSGPGDIPDEKDIAKAVKGEKFAEALSALDGAVSAGGSEIAPGASRTALEAIASQYDLSNEENRQAAVRESAELLIKSRLNENHVNSEKVVKDLGDFITDDPFLKNKLLSILQKLRDEKS